MSDTDAGYEVDYDEAQRLVLVRLWGFWSLVTLAAFTARLLIVVGRARRHAPRYGMLSDSTAFPVQSALVAAGFGRLTRRGAVMLPGKTAIVVGSTLNKLQVERSMPAPNLRVFLDRADALAWLAQDKQAA